MKHGLAAYEMDFSAHRLYNVKDFENFLVVHLPCILGKHLEWTGGKTASLDTLRVVETCSPDACKRSGTTYMCDVVCDVTDRTSGTKLATNVTVLRVPAVVVSTEDEARGCYLVDGVPVSIACMSRPFMRVSTENYISCNGLHVDRKSGEYRVGISRGGDIAWCNYAHVFASCKCSHRRQVYMICAASSRSLSLEDAASELSKTFSVPFTPVPEDIQSACCDKLWSLSLLACLAIGVFCYNHIPDWAGCRSLRTPASMLCESVGSAWSDHMKTGPFDSENLFCAAADMIAKKCLRQNASSLYGVPLRVRGHFVWDNGFLCAVAGARCMAPDVLMSKEGLGHAGIAAAITDLGATPIERGVQLDATLVLLDSVPTHQTRAPARLACDLRRLRALGALHAHIEVAWKCGMPLLLRTCAGRMLRPVMHGGSWVLAGEEEIKCIEVECVQHSGVNEQKPMELLAEASAPTMLGNERLICGQYSGFAGHNVIVAVMSMLAGNSVILNKSSVQRGLLQRIRVHHFVVQEDSSSGGRFCDPLCQLTNPVPRNSKVSRSGLPLKDCVFEYGQVLVGHVTNTQDTSLRCECGGMRVLQACLSDQDSTKRCVHVQTDRLERPFIGAVVVGRHGHVGTCAAMYNAEDMPFTADGLVPDMIISPLADFSIGQLEEAMHVTAALSVPSEEHGEHVVCVGQSGLSCENAALVAPMYYTFVRAPEESLRDTSQIVQAAQAYGAASLCRDYNVADLHAMNVDCVSMGVRLQTCADHENSARRNSRSVLPHDKYRDDVIVFKEA